jgi:hypothetical protein
MLARCFMGVKFVVPLGNSAVTVGRDPRSGGVSSSRLSPRCWLATSAQRANTYFARSTSIAKDLRTRATNPATAKCCAAQSASGCTDCLAVSNRIAGACEHAEEIAGDGAIIAEPMRLDGSGLKQTAVEELLGLSGGVA